MSETLPKYEPLYIRQGETVKWRKYAEAYGVQRKPPTWTLTYTLVTQDNTETVASTTDAGGGDFEITLPAATTATLATGVLRWQAVVDDGSETFAIDAGSLEVLQDFAQEPRGSDGRSWAQRTLDAVEATMEGKASRDQLSYTVLGRSIGRYSWDELLQLRDRLRAEVVTDSAKEQAKRGAGTSRVIKGRF